MGNFRPDNFLGVYKPLIESTAEFSGTPAIAAGGGLVSASAGSNAAGTFYLPVVPNPRQPWRFGFLFRYGTADTDLVKLNIYNPNDYSWGEVHCQFNGGVVSVGAGGSSSFFLSMSNAANGSLWWFIGASDGNQVSLGFLPATHAGINGAPSYLADATTMEAGASYAWNYSNSGHTMPFTGMQQIAISTNSAATALLGVFFNIGSLTGGWDSRMQPPGGVPVSITRPDGTVDTTGSVSLPETYTGLAPQDFILVGHPNDSDSTVGFRTADPDMGAAFAYLRFNAQYAMATIRGDPSVYTGPYASEWGAPNGVAVRRQLVSWMRANLPNLRNLFIIGQSMGGLTGLGYALQYPGGARAMVGISAATNLTDLWNGANGGIASASTIQAAYPTFYVSLAGSNTGNALSNTTYWQQITGPGGILNYPYAQYPNKGAYAGGTTYNLNDVVYSAPSAVPQLADQDPKFHADDLPGYP
jgi:pimeloyl-ACP methyl ester carboxylesterase